MTIKMVGSAASVPKWRYSNGKIYKLMCISVFRVLLQKLWPQH